MKAPTPMPTPQASSQGFLVDVDGVLCIERQIVEGAIAAIEFLQKQRIPFLLITNTTRRSRYSQLSILQRFGFRVSLEQIISAPYAASIWLKEQQAKSIYLFLSGDAYREFADFRQTANKPEYVIVGDIGDDLTNANLNQAFRLVAGGAKMVALQKNRVWLRDDGPALDAGSFVAALEYASRKKSVLVGKPSKRFFELCIERLHLPREQITVVGDDFETDVKGARAAGFSAIYVQSGMQMHKAISRKGKADYQTIDSIAELPQWIRDNQQNMK